MIDTAGIRQTKDLVESIGIERSKNAIKEAKIVIHMHEPFIKENEEDKIIKELSKVRYIYQ